MKQFPALFTGKISLIRDKEIMLHINQDIRHVRQTLRPIPFHYRDAVSLKLKRMVDNDIIKRVVFQYKRLHFGFNTASEEFQKAVEELLDGLEGVVNISDDICEVTQEELDLFLVFSFRIKARRSWTHFCRLNHRKLLEKFAVFSAWLLIDAF